MPNNEDDGYLKPLVLRHIRVTQQVDQEVQSFADQYNMSWTAAANILMIYGKAALENLWSAVKV